MNFLKGVSVYLSGAIEATQDKGTTWRQRVTPFLENLGMNVWDPLVKPDWVPEANGVRQTEWKKLLIDGIANLAIEGIIKDNSSLRKVGCSLANNCNTMIVKIDKTIFTVGTWEEVMIGQRRGIPMFFLCAESIPSMWLLDMVNAYQNPEEVFFQTELDLFKHLQLIDNNSTKVDNIAWIFKTYKETKNV